MNSFGFDPDCFRSAPLFRRTNALIQWNALGIEGELGNALDRGTFLLRRVPVWAAGQAMEVAAPAQQDEVVQVVVPEGQELSDRSLDKARGEFEFAPLLAGAAWGAAIGAGTQMVTNSLQGEPLFKNVARAAVIGAVSGKKTVTKSVIVVKKYASGLVEAGAKTVIDWSKTAISTAKAFAATIASNWPWNKKNRGTRHPNRKAHGGGGGW